MYHVKNILSGFGIIYFGIMTITATINYIALPLLLTSIIIFAINNNLIGDI